MMVVVALWVIDGKRIVSDGSQLDGFNGLEHIHAAEAKGVALAFRQVKRRLLKDAAYIGRREVDVLLSMSAMQPATQGVAIEVPLMVV